MGQSCLAMWSFTIAIAFVLSVTSSQGGLVRRSINDKPKPYTNGIDLLTMGEAGEAIKRSFQAAGAELEQMAEELENEVESITKLTTYIDLTETEKISKALAEAMDIKSLLNDQRTELSSLADTTIRQCDIIVRKFKETAAGTRKLDRGMRSILRSMRTLLSVSEEKLKEAKDTITAMREKINKVLATLRFFKGLISAAKEKEEDLKQGRAGKTTANIIGGIMKDIKSGADGYRKAKKSEKTYSIIESVVGGLTRLTTAIVEAVNMDDIAPMLDKVLSKVDDAIDIVERQKEAMQKELALITVWKDAVNLVKQNVFQGKEEKGEEEKGEDEQEIYNEIEEIIEEGDVKEITDSFEGLKKAAEEYLKHISEN